MNFLSFLTPTSEHLLAVVDLDQRCLGGLWSAEGYRREMDSPNSDLFLLMASAQPDAETLQPVGLGCAWAILEEAHITVIGVDPQYQRQGLGQLILYELLASARQRGLERATLEVRASNQAAIALYQTFGFREAGRRRRYYPDDEDALILWRSGLQYPEFETCLQAWRRRVEQKLQQQSWQFLEQESSFSQLGSLD